jgi:Putative adhesin
MRTIQMRCLPPLAAAALAVGMIPATLHADAPFREAHDADPQGMVEIIGITDSVEVTGWDQPRVELTAEEDLGNRLHFTSHGQRTVIDLVPGGGKRQVSVHVPSGSTLTVTVVNGNITVHGVAGDATLRSVGGNITGEVGANVRANSVTGNIRLAAPGAKSIEAKTINGEVDLKGSPSEVEVVTVSGSAKVQLGALTRGRFKTISGNVNAALGLAHDGELEGESVSGNLRFDFPAAPGAQFDVQSFGGNIDSCFGPKPESMHYGPGSRLEFKSGDGSGHVHIETKSGDVHLCAPH